MLTENIPLHVAIIPDGNRRWAKEKGLDVLKGVAKSAKLENIVALLDEAQKIGVKCISFWGFSTENWNRSATERKFIFDLILKVSTSLKKYCLENGVRFRHIGRKDRLPKELIEVLEEFERETADNDKIQVQFCLDYGGRDGILRAVQKIIKEGKSEIDEKGFFSYLDTKGAPEPDLIIRTGGEKRLSGFFLYEGAYAELYFSDLYFPDFGPKELNLAVEDFSNRKRNFGS